MASLRETKDRIGSVRSTLKITSAMKLVASAKLRKAQKAIEGMRPYERTLAEILAALPAAPQRTNENYFSDKFAEKPISAPPSSLYGGISPEPPTALKSLSNFADGKVTGPGRSADADVAALRASQEPLTVKIYRTEKRPDLHAEPGTVLSDGKTWLAIATADGALSLTEIQLAGKKKMAVAEFLKGFREPEAWKALL